MENLLITDSLRNITNSFYTTSKNQEKLYVQLINEKRVQEELYIQLISEQTASQKLLLDSYLDSIEKLEKERNYYKNLYEKSLSYKTIENNINISNDKNDGIDVILTNDNNITSIGNNTITNNSTSMDYTSAINNYLIDGDKNSFIEIIKSFPDKIDETLKLCRNKLPEAIDNIAETYGFSNELSSVKTYNNNLEKLNHNKFVDINQPYLQLCDNYNNAFNRKQPTLIKRYIKLIYIKYPDKFEEFTSRYTMPSNFNKIINKIKLEFKIMPKPNKNNQEKRYRTNFKTISVEELIEQINNRKLNKKGFIIRYANGLFKQNRLKDHNIFKNHFLHIIT